MKCRQFWFILLCLLKISSPVPMASVELETTTARAHPNHCRLLVIAHRGASGYAPEHTLGAYALAALMGADYIEPDLVSTSDGHLIARHDNELSMTTDVGSHPEFTSRRQNKTIDGTPTDGWFTEDFTLAEIKTLRAKERIPNVRPNNAKMDGTFTIPTFEEIIDLVKSLEISQKRTIGIYPEIKHSTHFQLLNLSMEQTVVEIFRRKGYSKSTDPVYIQSFEVSNLREINNYTDLKLLQLYDKKDQQPIDQAILGTNLTYGDMATEAGLQEVAKYADAVGPDKSYIIALEDNKLGEETTFVADAHKAGLKVHPYTFRAENHFLPDEFRSENGSPTALGDFSGEMRRYAAAGIDGVFSEHPDLSIRFRGTC